MNTTFLKRLFEEAVVAFLAGATAALAASGGSLDKAALVGALAAGGRAVFGILVKPLGDKDRPSL